MASDFLRLYGLTSVDDIDLPKRWEGKTAASPLLVPIGLDESGTPVALDFSRFHGLDDHVLVVGAPRAGTTNLMRAIMFGLTLARSSTDLVYLVVDSNPESEFQELTRLPNCLGAAECWDEQSVWRLAQWMGGEIERREAAFEAVGADNLSEYLLKVTPEMRDPARPSTRVPYAEYFLIIDDISSLVGSDFDIVCQNIRNDGHRLGIRMIVRAAQPTWERLKDTDYFDGLTARIALGLPASQSSELFGVNVSDDLTSPGEAYLHTQQGGLIKLRVPFLGELYRAGIV